MESLAESIGKLSTNAKEWKPGMAYMSSSDATAPLTPKASPRATTNKSSTPSNNNGYLAESFPQGYEHSSPKYGGDISSLPIPLPPISPRSPNVQYNSVLHHTPPGRNTKNAKWHPPPATEWGASPNVKEFVPGRGYDSGKGSSTTSGFDNTMDGSWKVSPSVNGSHHNQHIQRDVSSQQNRSPEQHQLQHLSHNGAGFFVPGRGLVTDYDDNGHSSSSSNIPSSSSNVNYQNHDNSSSNHDADDSGYSWWMSESNSMTTTPSAPLPARDETLHSLGLPDPLWNFYRALALESLREMEPNDARHKAVPSSFSHAYPLDNKEGSSANSVSSSFGYPSSVFKVMSRDDGQLYCLRRLDNVRCVSHKIAAAVTDQWSAIKMGSRLPKNHPGVCCLHRCFVSQRAVFFLHDYHPGAITLEQQYLNQTAGGGLAPLPEPLIWSFATQLVSALRAIHVNNLACRCLQPNHILCTPDDDDPDRMRLRISTVGVLDALEFEARKPLIDLQREDIRCLGRVILSLATRTTIFPNTDGETLQRCELFVAQNYGAELHGFAMSLLMRQHPHTIYEVCGMIASHAFDELDVAHSTIDRFGMALRGEYESGRALRLLLKLGFVNERPEFARSTRWSETGDCYVLKLFRDYVFHQADANGNPVMDLGHVVSALNKLDAADDEQIVLTSRDGKSLLVVSFADVYRCLEGAYAELLSAEGVGAGAGGVRVGGANQVGIGGLPYG